METLMKHELDGALTMLAQLKIRPDKCEDFLDYTITNLELSRSARGNIAFDILVDEAHPEDIVFYEVWESLEAQQTYMAWRVERGDLTTLLSFLAAEPKFTALRRIAR